MKLQYRHNGLQDQIINDVPKLLKSKKQDEADDDEVQRAKRRAVIEGKYEDKVRSKNTVFNFERKAPPQH